MLELLKYLGWIFPAGKGVHMCKDVCVGGGEGVRFADFI